MRTVRFCNRRFGSTPKSPGHAVNPALGLQGLATSLTGHCMSWTWLEWRSFWHLGNVLDVFDLLLLHPLPSIYRNHSFLPLNKCPACCHLHPGCTRLRSDVVGKHKLYGAAEIIQREPQGNHANADTA